MRLLQWLLVLSYIQSNIYHFKKLLGCCSSQYSCCSLVCGRRSFAWNISSDFIVPRFIFKLFQCRYFYFLKLLNSTHEITSVAAFLSCSVTYICNMWHICNNMYRCERKIVKCLHWLDCDCGSIPQQQQLFNLGKILVILVGGWWTEECFYIIAFEIWSESKLWIFNNLDSSHIKKF